MRRVTHPRSLEIAGQWLTQGLV